MEQTVPSWSKQNISCGILVGILRKLMIVTYKFTRMVSNNEMTKEVSMLIQQSSDHRLNNSLRTILMDYLILHKDYPTDLSDILIDINIIFDLLAIVARYNSYYSKS